MDPYWLSAVSLLGTCGSNGIRVRSYRLPSEFHILNMLHSSMIIFLYVSDWVKAWTLPVWWLTLSCQTVGMHVNNVSPTMFLSPIQLSYSRQRHKEVNTLTTANSTAELTLPEEDDDYIIHIQTLSEGGLGPASDPIRIHQLSKFVVDRIEVAFDSLSVGRKKLLFQGLNHWNMLMPSCCRDRQNNDNIWHIDSPGPQSVITSIFYYLPALVNEVT